MRFYIVGDIALRAVIFAKVVAVAKTTHKFIVYCHASLIALNQATDTRYQFKQR